MLDDKQTVTIPEAIGEGDIVIQLRQALYSALEATGRWPNRIELTPDQLSRLKRAAGAAHDWPLVPPQKPGKPLMFDGIPVGIRPVR